MWRAAAKHLKAHLIFNAYGSVEFLHIQQLLSKAVCETLSQMHTLRI
jgi:hypothetical protein